MFFDISVSYLHSESNTIFYILGFWNRPDIITENDDFKVYLCTAEEVGQLMGGN